MFKTNVLVLYGDGVVYPGEPVIRFTHQSADVVAIVNYSEYGQLVACDLASKGWTWEVVIWDPSIIPAQIVVHGTAKWSMETTDGRKYWLGDVGIGEYDGLPILSVWEYYQTNGKFPTRDSINDVALYAF